MFDPARSLAEVQALYDDSYVTGHYRPDTGLSASEARARLAAVRRYRSPGRLLEIGSAGGYFLAAAERAGYAATGIEPIESTAQAARERFGVEVISGFVEDVKLQPEAYGAVCAWHVVEHIANPVQLLERVRATLRPGGLLFLEVPNADSVQARAKGLEWEPLRLQHHVGHYAPRSIRALLTRSGFNVTLIETVSWTSLRPPRRPRTWASGAVQLTRARANPWRPHPLRHDLLRAVARKP